MNGPDFLCIGMQKAGTSWLFDQLQHHPDFWMPPVKELHYFDRDFPDRRLALAIARADKSLDDLREMRSRSNERPLDERDLGFFADAKACKDREPSVATYGNLFRHKGNLLSGDMTPALCTLAEKQVRELTEQFPNLRVVMLIRDPVERAWSQISMSFRREKFKRSWLNKADKFEGFLRKRDVESRSFATRIHERWAKYVPEDRFRYFFFDDLSKQPDTLRKDAIAFIGGDPAKSSAALSADYNRKSDREKLEMTELVHDILIRHFAEEIRACAATFGGAAKEWAVKYHL
jgi:hypothetical protein